jgi:hypothetical protein
VCKWHLGALYLLPNCGSTGSSRSGFAALRKLTEARLRLADTVQV